MTAADKREELEAAVWRATTGVLPAHARKLVKAILDAADAYATAVADERIAGRVHDRTIGRERLAEAAAAIRDAS